MMFEQALSLLVDGALRPVQSVQRALRYPLDLHGAWIAMLAASFLSSAVIGCGQFIMAVLGYFPYNDTMLFTSLLSVIAQILFTFVLVALGQPFGGKGQLRDVLVMMAWVQMVMILPSLAVLVGFVVLPQAAAGMMIAAAVLTCVYTVVGLCAAHGISSKVRALGLFFAAVIVTSLLSSLIASLFGIPISVGLV